jgi:hypothetical protein
MQTFKVTFAAAMLLGVAYILYIATDTILWFIEQFGVLALQSARVCGGMFVVTVGALLAWLLLRQQYERNRQRDGAFALREYWLEPWPKRVANWFTGRPSPRAVLDMNANISHAAVVANTIYTVEPSAGWDRQLAYMQDIERTRRTEAAVPGDGVLGLPWWSDGGRGGVANAPTARLLAGAYDRQIKPATIDQPAPAPQLPAPDLTPAAALCESRPASLVMGQTDSGDLVRWDMRQTPHLRFHGATRGAGKTNAIQTVAAGALVTGAHVVVFDPASLKDWGEFTGRAELVDTTEPQALADGAARLMTIYHNRTRQLAKAGARDVSHMARPPRRIVVVLCEFGAQCELARAEGVMGDIETPLLQLTRKAAATGIHLVIEDQAVERWPRALSANVAGVAIGRMPLYDAQACGFVPRRGMTTETLAPGQFWFGGLLLRTPHMEPELRTLLASVPAPAQLVMLTPPWKREGENSSQSVHGPVHGTSQDTSWASSPEVDPPPANSVNSPMNTAPTTVEGWYEWTLDNYLPAHPELLRTDKRGRGIGVQALAEAMAALNGKTFEAMGGTASGVAKRLRSETSLPSGQPLGTDTTTGGAV